MNPASDDVIKMLCDIDQRAFERALDDCRRRWKSMSDPERLVDTIELLGRLSVTKPLGPSEMSRRCRICVETVGLPDVQLRELASSLSKFPPAVRQAVTSALPPPLRRLVYSSQPQEASPAPALVSSPAPSRAGKDEAATNAQSDEPRRASNVILLGTLADHEENVLTLKKHDFSPLRATTIDRLKVWLDHDVCGIVVARSWWSSVPQAEREGILFRIVSHSTFAWLKIDSQDLPVTSQRLDELLLETRHAVPTMGECVCHDGWRLSGHDITALKNARKLLTGAESVRLCPADIQETQALVLAGAAIKQVAQRNAAGPFRVNRVDTSLIPGGRSQAKIIRLAPDDDGTPFVAKVDDVERLREEMQRFRRYAQRWDASLNPCLHFHSGISLILFGLVESPDKPGQPAPTLEETLETMFYCEHWGDYQGPSEDDLRELIKRTIKKLQRLNSQPGDGMHKPLAFLQIEPYRTLRTQGHEWKIGHSDGSDGSIFDYEERASVKVAELEDRSIVHGDVQLRNILVRDGREPHFIDYAYCGPGHPCLDLARLESAILFFCGRMNGDEREFGSVLFDVLDGKTEEDVKRKHPSFCTTRTNRLAIFTSLACRAAAFELLGSIDRGEDDWLAMKYVISCQSLFMISMQSGVVRAQLSALGAYMKLRRGW